MSAETDIRQSTTILEKIEATKPLLYELAGQLLETDKDRWNVIIGEDAGGRLPAHFVHKLLKRDDRDLKTFFVTGSKIYRDSHGLETYDAYFQHVTEQIGEQLRPLIVTESIGSGGAVDCLREALAPYCAQTPEVATVAVQEYSKSKADYAGGVGQEPMLEVWEAYESVPELSFARNALRSVWRMLPVQAKRAVAARTNKRITPASPNGTAGIRANLESDTPIAAPLANRNALVATRAFRMMDHMADSYIKSVSQKAS